MRLVGVIYKLRVNSQLEPDPHGTATLTYLPMSAAAAEARVSPNTILRWTSVGLVRTAKFGHGIVVYRMYDVTRLATTRSNGDRSPESVRRKQLLADRALQDATLPAARTGEPWDVVEDAELLDTYEAGGTTGLLEFCIGNERSYHASMTRLQKLLGWKFVPDQRVVALRDEYEAEVRRARHQECERVPA